MSTEIAIEQKTDLQQFSELQAQLTVFLAPITAMKITNLEESAAATKSFRDIRSWSKKCEDKLKEINAPHKAQIEKNKAFVEQVMAPLLAAQNNITIQQVALEKKLELERKALYQAEQEAQRKRDDEARAQIKAQQEAAAAKARAIQEEAEMEQMFLKPDDAEEAKAKASAEVEVVMAEANAESSRIAFESVQSHRDVKTQIKQVKVAGTRRTWKFDIVDESQIPEEYKMKVVDEKKIKAAVTHMDLRILPGVRIYEDIGITTR
jgi:hypothetical protein